MEIDTTPPGGLIDLFYVRRNFQKRFEQAEAPVIVLLPKRIEAGPRDSVKVRAYREGYRQEEVSFRVSSRRVKVLIDLEPLPNTLEAIAHSYFVGRASLVFLTKEALTSRLQEADDGFSLILLETAQSPDAIASIEHVRSPLIEKMWAQQLGEDLQIRVFLTELARTREVQLRSRESYDVARELYSFSLDLLPASGGGDAVRRTLAALDALEQRHVSGCSLRFDQTLREDLDPGSLARALVPNGRFADPYLRAAMRRLGEVSPGGVVQFGGGTEYRPAVPIELEAALMQASGAAGYLALLRQLVKELESEEYQRETLRGLIAPELDAGRFETLVDAAEARERDCLAAAARG